MSATGLPCGPTSRGRAPASVVHEAFARARVPGWLSLQVLLPLAAFAVVQAVLLAVDGDRWLASHLYAWEGGHWGLRNAVLTQDIVHTAGRNASTLLWLVTTIAALVAWRRPDWAAWRRPLACLSLSVLLSTALVAVLKHVTGVDCPWDIAGLGGDHAYVGLFAHRAAGMAEASGCFPAGHASAGYAWVALYFFLHALAPRWRRVGLGIGLASGLVFGVAQQLRGAHFVSHDLWSLMLCWLTAVAVYRASLWWALASAARSIHRRATRRVRALERNP